MAAITWRNIGGASGGGDASSFMRLATEGVEDATSNITGAIQKYGSDKQSLNDQLIEKNTNRFLDVLNEAKTPGAVADVQERLTELRDGGFIDRDAIRGAERDQVTKLRLQETADYEHQQTLYKQEVEPFKQIFDGMVSARDQEGADAFLSENREAFQNAGIYADSQSATDAIAAYSVRDVIAVEEINNNLNSFMNAGEFGEAWKYIAENEDQLVAGGQLDEAIENYRTTSNASRDLGIDAKLANQDLVYKHNETNDQEEIDKTSARISDNYKKTIDGTHTPVQWVNTLVNAGWQPNSFFDAGASPEETLRKIANEVYSKVRDGGSMEAVGGGNLTTRFGSQKGSLLEGTELDDRQFGDLLPPLTRADVDQIISIALSDVQPGSNWFSNDDVTDATERLKRAVVAQIPGYRDNKKLETKVNELKLRRSQRRLSYIEQTSYLNQLKLPDKQWE